MVGRPVRFATREAALLDARLLAFDIEGLDPGLYAVEGAGEALKQARLDRDRVREHYEARKARLASTTTRPWSLRATM